MASRPRWPPPGRRALRSRSGAGALPRSDGRGRALPLARAAPRAAHRRRAVHPVAVARLLLCLLLVLVALAELAFEWPFRWVAPNGWLRPNALLLMLYVAVSAAALAALVAHLYARARVRYALHPCGRFLYPFGYVDARPGRVLLVPGPEIGRLDVKVGRAGISAASKITVTVASGDFRGAVLPRSPPRRDARAARRGAARTLGRPRRVPRGPRAAPIAAPRSGARACALGAARGDRHRRARRRVGGVGGRAAQRGAGPDERSRVVPRTAPRGAGRLRCAVGARGGRGADRSGLRRDGGEHPARPPRALGERARRAPVARAVRCATRALAPGRWLCAVRRGRRRHRLGRPWAHQARRAASSPPVQRSSSQRREGLGAPASSATRGCM